MITRSVAGAAVVLLLGLVSGCGSPQEPAVAEASARFYRAVADQDGSAACDLLAPRTRSELVKSAHQTCARAILDEDIPSVSQPRRVQAFGTMAKVDFEAETAFLARFQGGWKVMAAGCTERPNRPYDCQVQGG